MGNYEFFKKEFEFHGKHARMAGELWVKGPQVMQGYWQRPDETAKALDSRGFLASGVNQ